MIPSVASVSGVAAPSAGTRLIRFPSCDTATYAMKRPSGDHTGVSSSSGATDRRVSPALEVVNPHVLLAVVAPKREALAIGRDAHVA